MVSLSDFLRATAKRCRGISRATYELEVATELRHVAESLDEKAVHCLDVDCDEKKTHS
jgi:hypothetical protein